MLGVRYGRLALAKLSSRSYEDRALVGKGIGKALQGRFRMRFVQSCADRKS